MKNGILLIFCFVLIFIANISHAQKSTIDSLENLIPHVKTDTTKIDVLLSIAHLYFSSNPDSNIYYAEKAKKLAQSINDLKREADALNRIATGYGGKGDLANALFYAKASLEMAQKIGNRSIVMRNMGNIALIYGLMGDSKLELEYQHKTLLLNYQLGDSNHIATTLNNIGRCHISLDKYDSAEYFLRVSIVLLLKYRPDLQSYAYFNLGDVKWRQKQNKEAKENLTQALYFTKKFYDKRNLSNAYRILAEVVLAEDSVNQAEAYIKQAIIAAEESKMREMMYKAYDIYSKILRQKGDFKTALIYKDLFMHHKDSLQSQAIKSGLQMFESQKKDNEITFVAQEKKNQRNIFIGLLLIFVLGMIGLAIIVYQKQKSNHALNKQKEEISTQAKQLDELNKLKDKLFSVIAHDLRSPINSAKDILKDAHFEDISTEDLQRINFSLTNHLDRVDNVLENLL